MITTNLPHQEKEDIYNALAIALANDYAKFSYKWEWETTAEIALEKALKSEAITNTFGEISPNTKIDVLAERIKATEYANNVLAEKEAISPQKDILRLNAVKDYNNHIDYLRKCPKESVEFCTSRVYDSINNGRIPSLWEYTNSLVEKSIRAYNNELRQNIIFFSIPNWQHLIINIKQIISGYILAHKVGELKEGKSHIEILKNIDLKKDKAIIEKLTDKEVLKTFDELFYNQSLITPCLNVLRQLDEPVISEDLKSIIGQKSIVVVWAKELKNNHVRPVTNSLYAKLLSKKFTGFSVDATMLNPDKTSKKAETFRPSIKALLKRIT